jgi:hypothetical protein
MKSPEKIRSIENYTTKSLSEICRALGIKSDTKEYNNLKVSYFRMTKKGEIKRPEKSQNKPKKGIKEKPELTIDERVNIDIHKAQESAKIREYKVKYTYVLKKLEESEKQFDALIGIKESVDIIEIEPVLSYGKHEACPVVMLSDWHFEERVDSQNINGLNHYDLDIAQKRWNTCIQNSMKLVHRERYSSEIKQIIIWLGGDFITGYIHEELEESNYLSPVQAVRFAKQQIITALKFYAEHGKFEKIIVVCNYGNHGRTMKKPRVSTSYKNSYEWMMYKDIQDYFSANKKFEFVVPDGLFAYISIYGFTNRFWHGDTIQYGGGIGGLTIPLIKAIGRYNTTIKADFNFMGHYHQLFEATKDCMVNGSGIGYSAYAQRIGASLERPQQGFKVIDSKHGYTTKLQIFCE